MYQAQCDSMEIKKSGKHGACHKEQGSLSPYLCPDTLKVFSFTVLQLAISFRYPFNCSGVIPVSPSCNSFHCEEGGKKKKKSDMERERLPKNVYSELEPSLAKLWCLILLVLLDGTPLNLLFSRMLSLLTPTCFMCLLGHYCW